MPYLLIFKTSLHKSWSIKGRQKVLIKQPERIIENRLPREQMSKKRKKIAASRIGGKAENSTRSLTLTSYQNAEDKRS
jgi:hypothetical protein